jgi:hypothetical protein
MLKIDTIAGKGHWGENCALNIAVQAEIYIIYTQQINSFIQYSVRQSLYIAASAESYIRLYNDIVSRTG